jgi:hypothetical protein
MIKKIIPLAIAAAILGYSGSCQKKEEPVKPSAGLEQLLAASKDSMSNRYEALRYYDDSVKATIDNSLASEMTLNEYNASILALHNYSSEFLQADNDNCSLAQGLAAQDQIKVILKYAEGMKKPYEKVLVNDALDLWANSLEYTSMLNNAQRYDIKVYEDLLEKAEKLKIKDSKVIGLSEHIRYYKSRTY